MSGNYLSVYIWIADESKNESVEMLSKLVSTLEMPTHLIPDEKNFKGI